MHLQPLKYDILSQHVVKERLNRFTTMLDKVGYNGVVRSVVDDFNPAHTQHITDTGMLIITGKDEKGRIIVVTGFLLTIDKLTAIYKNERIPQFLYKKVLYNMEKYKEIFTMND